MTTGNAETKTYGDMTIKPMGKNNGVVLNINYSSLIFIVFLTGLTELSGYFPPARMAGKKCISPGRKVMRRLGTLV